ncbi:putative dehydrodolichyl diphosphate synthase complex subunit Nus1 [Helianthus annuus]|nr:putative dehydrodolichyl diphosphate synthase complex subunit Nus1 [Helianthus annuus]
MFYTLSVQEIFRTIESYLITNGYVKKYTNLNLDWVKYLGIVIGSDEARNTSQVVELLEWLSAIGLKKICLYDQEDAILK